MIELINEPINNRFYDLVSSSKSSIRLCAPYVKKNVIENIYQNKQSSSTIECVSNFSLANFYKKSSDIEAFEKMKEREASVFNCQNLHAKMYIFDEKKLIVTSANLTYSGFNKNLEYGVYIDDLDIVNDSLSDYSKICDNKDTGKITLDNIQSIKGILDKLPKFINTDIYIDYVNEVDDILDVDKAVLTSNFNSWKKNMFHVLDSMIGNEFDLNDLYKYDSYFKDKYPNNNTVRDSMRRNLQELRDLGLIKFLGNGKYKKLWK